MNSSKFSEHSGSVPLCPCSAPSSSDDIPATSGRCNCKAAIKREQNQACLNSAEHKQSRGFNRKSTKIKWNKALLRAKICKTREIDYKIYKSAYTPTQNHYKSLYLIKIGVILAYTIPTRYLHDAYTDLAKNISKWLFLNICIGG